MADNHADISFSDTEDPGSRLALRALFAEFIPDIAEAAVPAPKDDHLYAPLALQAVAADGRLVGGILACRPQIAVAAHMARDIPKSPLTAYKDVLDRIVCLDMIAVRPDHRGKGIATTLLSTAEERLRSRGATILFGNVADGDEVQISSFYRRAGFVVLSEGQDLPPFLGLDWTMPNEPAPRFWFYKKLTVRSAA